MSCHACGAMLYVQRQQLNAVFVRVCRERTQISSIESRNRSTETFKMHTNELFANARSSPLLTEEPRYNKPSESVHSQCVKSALRLLSASVGLSCVSIYDTENCLRSIAISYHAGLTSVVLRSTYIFPSAGGASKTLHIAVKPSRTRARSVPSWWRASNKLRKRCCRCTMRLRMYMGEDRATPLTHKYASHCCCCCM